MTNADFTELAVQALEGPSAHPPASGQALEPHELESQLLKGAGGDFDRV